MQCSFGARAQLNDRVRLTRREPQSALPQRIDAQVSQNLEQVRPVRTFAVIPATRALLERFDEDLLHGARARHARRAEMPRATPDGR
jgi:hypothetical protein